MLKQGVTASSDLPYPTVISFNDTICFDNSAGSKIAGGRSPIGIQPSPYRAALRRAGLECPPIQTGGLGFWIGFGRNPSPSIEKNCPLNLGVLFVHNSLKISRYSSVTAPRLVK